MTRGASTARTYALIYPYVRCVVPRCMVRTKVPNEYGICPRHLHDESHDAYLAKLNASGVPLDPSLHTRDM